MIELVPASSPRPRSIAQQRSDALALLERTGDLPGGVRARASQDLDPRAGVTPNPNAPLPSVGPNVPDGYGDTHVMYPGDNPPPEAQAWQGWPVEWDVPKYEAGFGFALSDFEGWTRRVSTVMTAAELNAKQIASFPIYGVDTRSGLRRSLPSWAWNPEPLRYASWDEFAKQAFLSIELYGELILLATARDSTGYPARFVVLHPETIEVESDGEGGAMYSLGAGSGGGIPLDRADVCHVKYASLPLGLRGIGPLEWVGRSLVSAEALEKYSSDIALHGTHALLRHPGNINRKQADDLKASWMNARAARPSAPAVLPGGIEYEQLSISPRDMALLDLRIFDEQRIAAAFGVPPFLIGLPQAEGLTYSNATSLFDFHWRATLRPLAQMVARALSLWTLPAAITIEFDRDEYVRPDLEGRSRAYQTLRGIVDDDGKPAMSVGEIRAAERLQPYKSVTHGSELAEPVPPFAVTRGGVAP